MKAFHSGNAFCFPKKKAINMIAFLLIKTYTAVAVQPKMLIGSKH